MKSLRANEIIFQRELTPRQIRPAPPIKLQEFSPAKSAFKSTYFDRNSPMPHFSETPEDVYQRRAGLIKEALSVINKKSSEPAKIRKKCDSNSTLMQQKRFKQWFKSRGILNAHMQYYYTGAEVKADTIIDDMFDKLDADGGGTLDNGEFTALFKQNGIHMTEEQVANMFGEAFRMEKLSQYRKKV